MSYVNIAELILDILWVIIRTVSALIFILNLQYKIHKTLKPAFMPIWSKKVTIKRFISIQGTFSKCSSLHHMAQDCLLNKIRLQRKPWHIFHIYLLQCQETAKNATMQQIMQRKQNLCSLLINIVYVFIGLLSNDSDLIMTLNG